MTGIIINNNSYTVNTGSIELEYNSTGNTVGYSIYGEEIPLGTATLTINPTPADAVVTINGQTTNSLMVTKGAPITYTVSKTDYITRTGTTAIFSDETINITLVQSVYDFSIGTTIIDLPEGDYRITAISGGAGGAASKYIYGSNSATTAGGTSGDGLIGIFHLPAGTYTAEVGAGGKGKLTSPPSASQKYDSVRAVSDPGGNTILRTIIDGNTVNIVYCYGPSQSSAYWPRSHSYIESSSASTSNPQYNNTYLVSLTYQNAGTKGGTAQTQNINYERAPGPLSTKGYDEGYGGKAYGGQNGKTVTAENGGNGKLTIEYLE